MISLPWNACIVTCLIGIATLLSPSVEADEVWLESLDLSKIDQDPLGQAARRIGQDGPLEAWARPLFDGTQAVGLFNRSREAATIRVHWKTLKLAGEQPVRDLWLRKDLGAFADGFETLVQPRGAALVKIGRPTE